MFSEPWHQFLKDQGAHITDHSVQDFGDANNERLIAANNELLCDLSHLGILKISGDDAPSFLQNLLSSDINAITSQHAQLSSLNTAKGRVIAIFLVWRNDQDFFLQLPNSLIANIQKKLSMYVLRAKVKIEVASEQLITFGLAGKNSAGILSNIIGATPSASFGVIQHSVATLINLGTNRYQVITTPADGAVLWKKLDPYARPVGSPCWDWLNIRAGIPVVLPATQELFVLQMLNLDLLGGVSFKKGCYPGQEIVARLHYLGKLKQRTFLAHIASIEAPQPNDPLFCDVDAGESKGIILNAAPAPQGGYDVLATLYINQVNESRNVHWKSPTGALLDFQPMPYEFPLESTG